MKWGDAGGCDRAVTGRPLVVLGHLASGHGRVTPALPHVPEGSMFVQDTGLESVPSIAIAAASFPVTQGFFLLKMNKNVLKGDQKVDTWGQCGT